MIAVIDSDVILSAALHQSDEILRALTKSMHEPFQPMVSNYILDEIHRCFEEKFPGRILELEAFLFHLLRAVMILPTPAHHIYDDEGIRHRPVFRAAINAGADYILTGDKDFLESGIQFPHIVSVQDFLAL